MIHVCEPSIIIDLYGVHLHDLLDVRDLFDELHARHSSDVLDLFGGLF